MKRLRTADEDIHFYLTGQTGEEATFRDALKAIVANIPYQGADDWDDEFLGAAVGSVASRFQAAMGPIVAAAEIAKRKRKYCDAFSQAYVSKDAKAQALAERNKISKRMRFQVLERDGFRCQYCGVHPSELEAGNRLELDHVVPLCRGGKSTKKNLATSCLNCNRGKRTGDTQRFEEACQ